MPSPRPEATPGPQRPSPESVYHELRRRCDSLSRSEHSELLEDLLHQAFVRLLEAGAVPRLAGVRKLRPYLNQMLRNLLRNLRRPQRDRGLQPLSDVPDDGPSPDDAALRLELSAQVVACLEHLPRQQQEVIRLHHLDGLSIDEIVHLLATRGRRSVTHASVRSLLHRARTRLARILKVNGVTPRRP